VEGAPELVAEIAASSAAIDLGDKKRAYRRNGIQEYIVWQVFDQKVD
jgi:Uma2 family endonuclease